MSEKNQHLVIEIIDPNVEVREGRREDGTKWRIVTQRAAWHVGDKYPHIADVTLGDDQKPWPVGFYYLAASSFAPAKYGMGFRREGHVLFPVPSSASQPSQSSKAA